MENFMLAGTPIELQDKRPLLLVADDEEIIRTRLQEMSAMLGFEVRTAKDGGEAWEQFQAQRPDIVILDIYMPKINGLQLMQKIKNTEPTCPVILITGFMHFEQLVKSQPIKPDGFITKPFNINTIINALLKLVLDCGQKR
ncbi:MAG: response regulator [Candidatus Zixiibacteriota bacterium]|nr:MAG: response regulator [candidate division Zixibacteria bacterium]